MVLFLLNERMPVQSVIKAVQVHGIVEKRILIGMHSIYNILYIIIDKELRVKGHAHWMIVQVEL
jgi:hypothetical protein